LDEIESIDGLDDQPRRRLRHVVSENGRVMRFANALQERDLPAAGRVISASHASLRDDYEVSIPELDETASEVESRGAYGARLLGGGFGGSVLALIDASRAMEVASAMADLHPDRRAPILVHASSGASVSSRPARPRPSNDPGARSYRFG
jgi:galactokinase